MMSASLEELWQNVQTAYVRSRCYRAGDDPEFAKALAAFNRADGVDVPPSNVMPFKRSGVRK